MKKMAWIILVSFVFALLAGCIVTRPVAAPPPPRKEVRIVKPGPNFVWIAGHWKWVMGKYGWVPGHWIKARPGKVWVPGHWEKRGRHWVWILGHWKRKRKK